MYNYIRMPYCHAEMQRWWSARKDKRWKTRHDCKLLQVSAYYSRLPSTAQHMIMPYCNCYCLDSASFSPFSESPKHFLDFFLLSRLSLCLSAEKAINWLLCEFAVSRPWVDRDHGKWIVYKHCRLEEIFSCSFAKGNFTLLTSWNAVYDYAEVLLGCLDENRIVSTQKS